MTVVSNTQTHCNCSKHKLDLKRQYKFKQIHKTTTTKKQLSQRAGLYDHITVTTDKVVLDHQPGTALKSL